MSDSTDTSSGAHAHEDHTKQYYKVLGYLTALTILEIVAAMMMKESVLGFGLGVTVLVVMAFVKAGLVGRYYMHLAFDPRLLAFLAISPLIFGALIVLVGWADAASWPPPGS